MKRLKSKRGIAIENALVFMVLIFSLCALLTTFVLIGYKRADIAKKNLLSRVAVDQIGEDYLAAIRTGVPFTAVYEKYNYAATETTLTVWRTENAEQTPLLYLEISLVAGEPIVLVWSDAPPEPSVP